MTSESASAPGSSYQKKKLLNDRRWEAINGVLMALPAVILLTVFLIVPFLTAFGWSFTNKRLLSPNETKWVGTQNYENLLSLDILYLEPHPDDPEEVDESIPVWMQNQDQQQFDGTWYKKRDGIWYQSVRNFTRESVESELYDSSLEGMQEWQSIKDPFSDKWVVLVASDPVFMQALINILMFVIIVVPGQGGLALVLALLLNQKLTGINIFRGIYFMPVIISMVVVAFLWRFMYDGDNGMLNTILGTISFGLIEPTDWLGNKNTALPAIMVMSIWQGVGFHMVIWLAGLQSIPTSLYEAASVAGANTWQKFRYVTWPGLRHTAVVVFVIITMQAFGLYTQIDTMTRGGPNDATQTIVFQNVIRGFEKKNMSEASAISVILFLLVLAVTIVQRYLTRERE